MISMYTTYAIGMNCPIEDNAALRFSEAFYGFLRTSSVANFEESFRVAKVRLIAEMKEASKTPELSKKGEKLDI